MIQKNHLLMNKTLSWFKKRRAVVSHIAETSTSTPNQVRNSSLQCPIKILMTFLRIACSVSSDTRKLLKYCVVHTQSNLQKTHTAHLSPHTQHHDTHTQTHTLKIHTHTSTHPHKINVLAIGAGGGTHHVYQRI